MIAVVGSLNMDMIVATDRIPRRGETVSGRNLQYSPGGKGSNQAVAAAKLGGKVEMFGCVGNDAVGSQLLKNLDAVGVGNKNVRILDEVPSGMAFITVGNGDNIIVVIAGANDFVNKDYIDSVRNELLKANLIMLQQEIPQETNEYVAQLAQEHGKTVILDPAPARPLSETLLSKVNYLTPNEHEAGVIFGNKSDFAELLIRYRNKLIITRGELGVKFAANNGEIRYLPAINANVVDTTGAGDTMNGALAFMLAQGKDLETALWFATCAAGCAVEKYGAQTGMPGYEQVLAKQNATKT